VVVSLTQNAILQEARQALEDELQAMKPGKAPKPSTDKGRARQALGLDEEASASEVSRAWRRISKFHHPGNRQENAVLYPPESHGVRALRFV
jgi:hypothetical protein